jgi:hypothetical protein
MTDPGDRESAGHIAALRARLALAASGGADEHELLAELAQELVIRHEDGCAPLGGTPTSDLDAAVACCDRLLAGPPGELAAAARFISAVARYYRFLMTAVQADLDAAIAQLSEDADDLPADGLVLLGEALAARCDLAPPGDPADVSAAIRVNTRVADLASDHDPAKASSIATLATLRYNRYQQPSGDGQRQADLVAAIEAFRWLRLAAGRGDPTLPEVTYRLGICLADQVLRHQHGAAEVTEAASALASASRLLAPGDPRHRAAVIYLGFMLGVRFLMHEGGPGDRSAALARLREALADPGLDRERAVSARLWLGQLLLLPAIPAGFSFRRPAGGDPLQLALGPDLSAAVQLSQQLAGGPGRADAREAAEHLSAVIEQSPGRREILAVAAMLLGSALLARRAAEITPAELDRAAGCFGQARQDLDAGASGQAELAAVQAWLAAETAARAGGAGSQPAAQALAAALERLTREHPLRPVLLYQRARMIGLEFMRQPGQALAAAAIEALTGALRAIGPLHPLRTDILALLGASFLSMAAYDAAGVPVGELVKMLGVTEADPSPDPVVQALRLACYGSALHWQAVQDRDYAAFPAALARVRRAAEILPPDHPYRSYLLLTIAALLGDQYDHVGDLAALDAAERYLNEGERLVVAAGGPAYNPAAVDRCMVWAVRGDVRLTLATRRESPELAGAAIADLESAEAAYPAGHPFRARVTSQLGSARMLRSLLRGDTAGALDSSREIVAAARRLPATSPDRGPLLSRAGLACVLQARVAGRLPQLDQGIDLLTEAAGQPGLLADQRPRTLLGLGAALMHRGQLSGDRADLDRAISRLAEAARRLAGEPASLITALVLATLAEAYHQRADPARGDLRAAVTAGVAALRERAGDVLLQSSPERALVMARRASGDAAGVAGWALEAGLPAVAVEALELGRGLVLHAATVVTGLPARLRAAGFPDLAAEWDHAAASRLPERGPAESGPPEDGPPGNGPAESGPADALGAGRPDPAAEALAAAGAEPDLRIPSDLRHRVLVALQGAAPGGLLDPPSAAQIAAAVAATGRDALAYLLRTPAGDRGWAVLLQACGSVTGVRLDGLAGRAAIRRIELCAAAQQQALQPGPAAAADQGQAQWRLDQWQDSLAALCAWAWPAAIGPLADLLPPGRGPGPVQLMIVPCGPLAAVPWHAARTAGPGGQPRYALQDLIFSYAASGRQLIETAARERLPLDRSPVIVADPFSADLDWARREARSIRAAYYPAARYLTAARRDDPAIRDAVLAALPRPGEPGASLLHTSCHAVAAASPELSYLLLAPGIQLPVSSVLTQAAGRGAAAPGGLVILSACMSDLTTRDHDEALTLATAFLAAGAVGVTGSRWQVRDDLTAPLMFMFHHYLNQGEPPPAALRATQLWMLDPRRSGPPEMPARFDDLIRDPDLAAETAWAAFAYQGR